MKNDRTGRRERAEPSVPTSYDYANVASILERWHGVPGALMPILHDVQKALGYVPPDSIPQLASALNLSRAEVHGVITFYHDFRQQPGGARTVKVCQAEACQAMGSRQLTADLEGELNCKLGETSADGAVTLEAVYCLGLCACSPAVMLDEDLIGRATPSEVLGALGRRDEGGRGVSTPITVYVPGDAGALALGADGTASAIAQEAARRGQAVKVVRNGSRGMFWLEPMVEVATAAGRHAYGPVRAEDVSSLFEAGFLEGAEHPLSHGPTDEIPWLKRQERLTYARVGITDPCPSRTTSPTTASGA